MTQTKEAGYEKSLSLVMLRLVNEGLISSFTRVGDRTYTAHKKVAWNTIARKMAGYEASPGKPVLGGQCVPINGIAWRMGRARGGNIIDAGNRGMYTRAVMGGYEEKTGEYHRGAREILADIIEDGDDVDRWTTGACARRLWRYISPDPDPYPKKRKPSTDAELLRRFQGVGLTQGGMIAPTVSEDCTDSIPLDEGETETEPIGYHDCAPGTYEHAQLWDVSAYYGSMLMRLAETGRVSLRPMITKHNGKISLSPGSWRDGERERLRLVMREIWDCKPLRNSMVGAALGTYRPMVSYAYDKAKRRGYQLPEFCGGPGPFRRLGLVIVRSGSDLCHVQALNAESVYSTVDSVCIPGGGKPKVWETYGFSTTLKAEGPAQICGFGVWGFGKDYELQSTIPFQNGERELRPVERPKVSTQLYTQWL